MAEPNPPSESDPVQSQGRHPSQDQTPADNAASLAPGESPSPAEREHHPNLSEDERLATGQPAFGGAISTPSPEGEFLTSPEQAQAKEAADRMRVYRGLRRELTEREWNSAGTRILILEQLAQLESELNSPS
jgi:hypothetical protein